MVEGRALLFDPTIGQAVCQEVYESCLIPGTQQEGFDAFGFLGICKVAAPVVKLDHLRQRRYAAVMEVGRGQLDVAQTGGLEGAAVFRRAALREGHVVRARAGPSQILRGRPHPVIVEALSPPSSLISPFCAAKLSEASVISAPAWHVEHLLLPLL